MVDKFELSKDQPIIVTCINKGGEYEVLGFSCGAGKSKGEILMVYRDTTTGQLFHRTEEDFYNRMSLVVWEKRDG